jgi:hypothetical protein
VQKQKQQQGTIMSEREPGSGPKPKPPKQEWEAALERLQKAYEPQPGVADVETPLAKVHTEQMQPELDSKVNAVEDIAVEEAPGAPVIVEAAVLAPAPVETTPAAPVEVSDADMAALEASFAAPAAVEPGVLESQQAEKPAIHFVDKRNAESQAWSKESRKAADVKTAEVPAQDAVATDAEVTPNEIAEVAIPKRGEHTHHDYHAQRPADGSIYRAGKTYQRASGGAEPTGFVKNGQEEYVLQNGAHDSNRAQKHYDEVMGTNEVAPATPERPSYETMDTDQLIFAYAKAEMIGDKHVTDDIRDVYTTAMEEAYTKPGSPITLEEHEEALARFDRMADAAIEYEKAKDPEHSALVDAAVERANREPSVGEKLKKFWNKSKEFAKGFYRPGLFTEMWVRADQKLKDGKSWALNYGIKPEDDDNEIERKRKRNRRFIVAGAAALGVAALGGSFALGFAAGSGGHHVAEAVNAGGGGNRLSAHDQAIANALTPHGAPAVGGQLDQHRQIADIAQNAAPAPSVETFSITDPGFNVRPDEGGQELFRNLHIDPAKWNQVKDDLLSKFGPHDVYDMGNGRVGLEDTTFSDAFKQYINTNIRG